MKDEAQGAAGPSDQKLDAVLGAVRATTAALTDQAAQLSEIHSVVRTMAGTLAGHTVEFGEIRGYMKDKLVTRGEFHARMDAFAGRVGDFDYSAAKQLARLDEHESRISALEAKRD